MAEQPQLEQDNFYNPNTQDFSPEAKTWGELIRIAIDQWIRCNLNVWLPGQITAVRNNSFVDVQPLLQERFIVQGLVTLPTLQNIPVEHLRGSDWWIKCPVAVGDYGRINFCDRSLDSWLVAGGGPLNPDDIRMHHLSDATFTPGLYPRNNVLPGNADDMILHNGQAEIYLQKGGTFKITNGVNELISTLVEASTVAGGPFTPDTIAKLVSLQGE